MKFYFSLLLVAALLTSCTSPSIRKSRVRSRPPVIETTPGSDSAKIESSPIYLPESQTSGNVLDSLKDLVALSIQAPSKHQQDLHRIQALDIVENKLDEDQLEDVVDESDFGFLRGHAMFRLGEMALDKKDSDLARKYFNSVIEYVPESDLALRAQEIIQQIDSAKNVEAQTIGVVLPLSGRNASVGQRALRGVEMGLGLHIPGSAFRLAVMDSEGNPDSARRGVERLIREDNVIAIVGSLLSKTAPAVAAKADEMEVPSIALSQRSGLTEIGPTVFRNSLTSGMQVRALVRTAMNEYGMRKFAILYPNDPYGIEFTNIFWDEVLARGGEITAVQTYSNKETDFRFVVQRLVGTYFGEARNDEFQMRLREIQQSGKKHSVRRSNLEVVLPPIVDFDAIFIPDNTRAMGQISAMLSYNDVRGVKLLGTNLWNTKDVSKRAGNFANNLIFIDSTSPISQDQSRFVSEYRAIYKEEPSLIEIQAYDSGLILRQLIASGANSRSKIAERLAQLNKFPGAIGNLSISPEREIERPVRALTVEKGQIRPLKILK